MILKRFLDPPPSPTTTVNPFRVSASSLCDAVSLFHDPNSPPSEPACSTLIDNLRKYDVVVSVYRKMVAACVSPRFSYLSALTESFVITHHPSFALSVLSLMTKRGFGVNVYKLNLAMSVFSQMKRNCDCVVPDSRLVEARVLFEVMKGGDFRPNLVTYSVLIDCYCKSGEVGEGFSLLEEMEREGLKADVFVHSSLISAFCGEGDVEKGRELFDEMLMRKVSPNVVTYSCLMQEDEAKVLDLMVQEGEEPGTLTYNVVVNGLCKEDRVDDALRVVEMMAKKGKKPDVVTYNTLLKGLCGAAKIDEAMELWKLLLSEKFHVKLDVFTFNNLIQGLCKEGRVHDAAMIHYSMVEMWLQGNIVTYNILIEGYLDARKLIEGLQLWKYAVESGFSPNSMTYSVMINGLCKMQMLMDVKSAKVLLSEMLKMDLVPDAVTFSILINRFSKLGMLYEAMALYEKMVSCGHVPDVVVFDSLLKGYGLKGETEKIISLLHQMADKDVVLDSKLTSTILACLCHMSRDLDVETILPKLSQQSEHTSKGATIKCHELLMKPNNVHPELKLYVAQ
ncbi:hypothetical protein AAZX31_18G179600 [Glycine max]